MRFTPWQPRWFREGRLPTWPEVWDVFEGIPEDPRTEYPIGYLGFALELEARLEAARPPGEWRDIRLQDGSIRRARVQECPPGVARAAAGTELLRRRKAAEAKEKGAKRRKKKRSRPGRFRNIARL